MNRSKVIIILSALTLSLSGCISINVPPNQVTVTNKDFGQSVTGQSVTGQPATGKASKDATVSPPFRFTDDKLDAGFGKIHYVLAERDSQKPLIVFCGGNAFREDLAGGRRLEALAPFGDVLFFEYPGLGSSDGTGLRSQYESTQTAILAKAQEIAANRSNTSIVFWGHSLGGGICANLASRTQGKSALIMEGAFASIEDVGKNIAGIAAPFVRIHPMAETVQYDSTVTLANYNQPIIVIASRVDKTVPFGVTQKLIRKLRKEGKTVTVVELETAAHSTPFTEPDYQTRVQKAFAEAGISVN